MFKYRIREDLDIGHGYQNMIYREEDARMGSSY